MRNKRLIPTRAQQIKQNIIDVLLAADSMDVAFSLIILILGFLIVLVWYAEWTHPNCAEGYIYIQRVCVQGYKP